LRAKDAQELNKHERALARHDWMVSRLAVLSAHLFLVPEAQEALSATAWCPRPRQDTTKGGPLPQTPTRHVYDRQQLESSCSQDGGTVFWCTPVVNTLSACMLRRTHPMGMKVRSHHGQHQSVSKATFRGRADGMSHTKHP
jgi:hypothetical protein